MILMFEKLICFYLVYSLSALNTYIIDLGTDGMVGCIFFPVSKFFRQKKPFESF